MSTMDDLKKRGKLLQPILQIGKNGLSEGTLALIDRELEQKELIKIKILKSSTEETNKKEIAKEISQKTQSQIIEQIGNVVVIYRKNNKPKRY